eukprot:scaffold84573_cov19-Prasinocladus_malaysianus.AAC.1
MPARAATAWARVRVRAPTLASTRTRTSTASFGIILAILTRTNTGSDTQYSYVPLVRSFGTTASREARADDQMTAHQSRVSMSAASLPLEAPAPRLLVREPNSYLYPYSQDAAPAYAVTL